MAVTNVRGRQLKDDDVLRQDLNTTVSGSAVIRKIIAGTNISLSSTGVDAGTGDVTISTTGLQTALNGTGYVKMTGTTVSYVVGSAVAAASTVVERDANGYIFANQFNGVNIALNTLRNNLGDPTTDEKALFHGQFNNKFRFLSPTSQEQSTDGATWTTSTRATAAQLGDLMIGEGQGTSFEAIPTGTIGVADYYRLTWDVVGSTGYVFLNQLYIYSSTAGNNVTATIEAFHNTNGWTTITSGVINNWPGHATIRHGEIPYSNNASQYSRVRITFSTTRNAFTNAFTLSAIEWFGGYPQGKRNVESYDRLRNVTFPAAITGTSIIRAGGTSSQFLKADGSVDVSTYLTTTVAASTYLPLAGGTLTGDLIVGTAASAANSNAFGTFVQVRFDNSHNDIARGPNKIVLHDNGAAWIGGFGLHSDTVAYYSGGTHRWYASTSQTAFTNTMTLDVNGNLGVGVAPSFKLDVNGTGHFVNTINSTNGGALFTGTIPTNWLYSAEVTAASRYAIVGQGNSTAATFPTINSYGSVGVVGATAGSTGGRVNIGVFGYTYFTQNMNGNGGNTGYGGYFLAEGRGSVTDFVGNYTGIYAKAAMGSDTGTGGSLIAANLVATGNAQQTTYGALISATGGATNYGVHVTGALNYFSGNVGIGASSPIARLQLGSSWAANPGGGNQVYLSSTGFANSSIIPELLVTSDTGNTTPGGSIGLALHNTNTTAGAFAPLLVFSKREIGASNYNASIAAIGARTVTGTGASDSWIDGELIFYTSPTSGSGLVERARLDQAGNLGVGVIPGAWVSTGKAIQVGTQVSLSDLLGDLHLTDNAYWNGTNWIYLTTGTASNYYQSLGAHFWRTAISGTAGATASFTQGMTLSTAGNLSVTGTVTGSSIIRSGGTASQFLKADGTVDSNTYLTANQTITLTGNVTGSGTTSIATTIANGVVTNAMLVNSSFNIGTTSISLGRASAAQSLTGITSIDGYANNIRSGIIADLNNSWLSLGTGIDNALQIFRYASTAANSPEVLDNANWVMNIYSHPSGGVAAYGHQISGVDNNNIYVRYVQNGGFGAWYKIWTSGTLTNLNQLTNGPGYITGNQTITLSGAVTGSGATAITTTLANSVVGIANLSATGTASASTYLRGDNTWANIPSANSTTRYDQSFVATAGQTVITVNNALAAGYFDVYINGVKANADSYTFSGTTITFVDALLAGDIVDVINYVTVSQVGTAYGTSYSMTSGVGTGTAIFDTIDRTGAALYEVVFRGNPNEAGSGNYMDFVYGKLLIGTGYNGSAVAYFIQFIQEAPMPRSMYASGGGNLTVNAVFLSGGSEYNNLVAGSNYTVRFKVSGYNAAYTGASSNIYLKQIG